MGKNKSQRLSADDVCVFRKSGNVVKLIRPEGKREWLVERLKGAAIGKRMICRESALQLETTWLSEN